MKQIWSNSEFNGPVDEHQYDVELVEDKYVLTRSQHGNWTNPGEHVGQLYDNGDQICVHLNEDYIELSYTDAFELLVLLLISKSEKLEIRELKTTLSI